MEKALTPLIDAPSSHLWDLDQFFSRDPEGYRELSKILTDLEDEREIEIFIVMSSSIIGEAPKELAMRCHEAWLGERNDGLVIVMSFTGTISGSLGFSQKLYGGHFIEEGILARVSLANIESIVRSSVMSISQEKDEVQQILEFMNSIAKKISERFRVTGEESASREGYYFMGWMALALIACGILMGLIAKWIRASGCKTAESFRFPDFYVPQRLRAGNGGGKVGMMDFEPPSRKGSP